MHPIIHAIYDRRSIRLFSGETIANPLLEEMVKAGMAAPSGRNRQPWQFGIVTERALLDALYAELPYAKMLDKAAAAIVVCGDPSDKYWVEDCSAATQNILLAADALGYGAVWTAVYRNPEREESVRRILQIPVKWTPLCVIPVGVSADTLKEHNNYDPDKIHWNQW